MLIQMDPGTEKWLPIAKLRARQLQAQAVDLRLEDMRSMWQPEAGTFIFVRGRANGQHLIRITGGARRMFLVNGGLFFDNASVGDVWQETAIAEHTFLIGGDTYRVDVRGRTAAPTDAFAIAVTPAAALSRLAHLMPPAIVAGAIGCYYPAHGGTYLAPAGVLTIDVDRLAAAYDTGDFHMAEALAAYEDLFGTVSMASDARPTDSTGLYMPSSGRAASYAWPTSKNPIPDPWSIGIASYDVSGGVTFENPSYARGDIPTVLAQPDPADLNSLGARTLYVSTMFGEAFGGTEVTEVADGTVSVDGLEVVPASITALNAQTNTPGAWPYGTARDTSFPTPDMPFVLRSNGAADSANTIYFTSQPTVSDVFPFGTAASDTSVVIDYVRGKFAIVHRLTGFAAAQEAYVMDPTEANRTSLRAAYESYYNDGVDESWLDFAPSNGGAVCVLYFSNGLLSVVYLRYEESGCDAGGLGQVLGCLPHASEKMAVGEPGAVQRSTSRA